MKAAIIPWAPRHTVYRCPDTGSEMLLCVACLRVVYRSMIEKQTARGPVCVNCAQKGK
jgi:hypothetical protein